jgi:hypothetical protein
MWHVSPPVESPAEHAVAVVGLCRHRLGVLEGALLPNVTLMR